jgi:outer membrane protein TolC
VAALSACATSATDLAPAAPDRPWTPATTPGGEIVAGQGRQTAADGYVLPANPALAALPAAPDFDPDKAYTLAELIDRAERANPDTRVAWDEARRSALAVGIAESAYLPYISATAVGGYLGGDGNEREQGGQPFAAPSSAGGVIAGVSLQWLLFDFGERAAVVDAARQGSAISNIAFTASHQRLIHDVSVAFYEHAAAQARQTAAVQSLKNAQDVQAAAESRLRQGTGTVIEVAQARQATAQAKLALVQAQGGVEDSYQDLVSAMGVSPLSRFKVEDISDRPLSPKSTASVEAIVSAALARRPDVQSAYAAEKASFAKVRAARAEFLPKVFVAGGGAYNSGHLDVTTLPSANQASSALNLTGQHWNGNVFAGVTVPLYDGGLRAAALAQARAEADGAQARFERVRDDAVRQVVVSDNALRTSLSAYEASQVLAAAAQTTFDAALAAYRNGVGSITDVTTAQTQLLQARDAATDAHSTALASAANLALAVGALGAAPS